MVRIAYVLPHVPDVEERRRFAIDLRRQLPTLRVYPDPERRGVWLTVRGALLDVYRRDPRATHVCILNDDLVLCRSFSDRLTEAVRARPEHLVQPFTMTRKQAEASARGDAWMTSFDLVAGSATFPTAWIADFVRDVDASAWSLERRTQDTRVAWWLVERGLNPVWHTVPSLVEHGLAGESSMGHSNRGRVARVFSSDPAHVDFSTIPEKPVSYSARGRTAGIEDYMRGADPARKRGLPT